MSDYTPSTDEVRDSWRRGRLWITGSKSGSEVEFDRWLAGIKADAWDEGWNDSEIWSRPDVNPYRSDTLDPS